MPTNKKGIQTYVSDEIDSKLTEYCTANNNLSKSKAIEIILEQFFSGTSSFTPVEEKSDTSSFTPVEGKKNSDTTNSPNIRLIEAVVKDALEPLIERIKLLETKVHPQEPTINQRELGLVNFLINAAKATESENKSTTIEAENKHKEYGVIELAALGDGQVSQRNLYRELAAYTQQKPSSPLIIKIKDRYYQLIHVTRPYRFIELEPMLGKMLFVEKEA